MKSQDVAVGVAVLGLVAAWYWSQKQTALVQSLVLARDGSIGQPGNPQTTGAPGAPPQLLSSTPILPGDGPNQEIRLPIITGYPDVSPAFDFTNF